MGKLGTIGGLRRVPTKLGYLGAGLARDGDDRALSVQNYHCSDIGLNMSLSIARPAVGGRDMMNCLACPAPHSVAEKLSCGKPVVVVLADQNFPPTLPAKEGDCVIIIRVEDGLLHELEGALLLV